LAAWPELPVLGIGATYSGALEPLIERHPTLFDVLEIEPQTMWIKTADRERPFRVADEVLAHLARLPGRKIIHNVGLPVGGTIAPDAAEVTLLKETVQYFGAPWVSDHLSFNHTGAFATGFFLPPRQTLAGAQTAAAAIRRLQEALRVPVAVETGANYLRPREDELPDGEFVARVVEMADCGVLLDLHNAYCNSVNGRQPLQEFLAQLPLDRVWEIHLAGGAEFEGFYLDAHAGAIPAPLHAVLEEMMPRLPHLKAIIFEIFPSFVPVVGLEVVHDQLAWLHAVWARRTRAASIHPRPVPRRSAVVRADRVPPPVWEQALGRLVVGQGATDEISLELARDPGIRVIARLIHEFRASMIVRVLPLTSRFLMLALGPDAFRTILADYWSKVTPQMYGSLEADAFARYLASLHLQVPHLAKILEFEQAVTATNSDGLVRVVHFDFEPLPLLRAIAEGRLPEVALQPGNFEIELTPDGLKSAVGPDHEAVWQAAPFH
jgi:uncharacterized protein (UPF0276 family)